MEFATLTTAAKRENLDAVVEFFENQAEHFGLDTRKKFGLLIAVEEAFINICSYAYLDGDGKVEFSCRADSGDLVLEIADQGSPFDVLSLPDPDTTSDIMDRDIGGLGVHFIRKLSDHVSYRRENEQNILQMVFQRTPAGRS